MLLSKSINAQEEKVITFLFQLSKFTLLSVSQSKVKTSNVEKHSTLISASMDVQWAMPIFMLAKSYEVYWEYTRKS